jgi:hypothetical protein
MHCCKNSVHLRHNGWLVGFSGKGWWIINFKSEKCITIILNLHFDIPTFSVVETMAYVFETLAFCFYIRLEDARLIIGHNFIFLKVIFFQQFCLWSEQFFFNKKLLCQSNPYFTTKETEPQ